MTVYIVQFDAGELGYFRGIIAEDEKDLRRKLDIIEDTWYVNTRVKLIYVSHSSLDDMAIEDVENFIMKI